MKEGNPCTITQWQQGDWISSCAQLWTIYQEAIKNKSKTEEEYKTLNLKHRKVVLFTKLETKENGLGLGKLGGFVKTEYDVSLGH